MTIIEENNEKTFEATSVLIGEYDWCLCIRMQIPVEVSQNHRITEC